MAGAGQTMAGAGGRAYSRLGKAFEGCPDCRRAVACIDVLYCATSLLWAVLIGKNLGQAHPAPDFTVTRMYLGPQSLALNYVAASVVVVAAAALPVLLLAVRPALWARHRSKLALANRLLRLGLQSGTCLAPGAVGQLSAAVVARARQLQENAPTKAAAVMLLHPMLLYVQPALVVLPWQLTCVLQSCSAAVTIWGYVRPLPCFVQLQLQPQGATAGGAALQPFEHVTQSACYTAQGLAAVLRTAVGDPVLSTFSASVCDAPAGSTYVLGVTAAIVCLVIVPTLATLCFEQQLDKRFCTRQLAAAAADAAAAAAAAEAAARSAAAGASSSSSRSRSSRSSAQQASSSRQRSAAQVRGEQQEQQQQQQEEEGPLQLPQLADAGAAGLSGWRPVALLPLLLVLLLPVAWQLSEVVAEALATTTDCSAVLAAAGVGERASLT